MEYILYQRQVICLILTVLRRTNKHLRWPLHPWRYSYGRFRWFWKPYAFLCSQMSSLIFRLSRRIPGSASDFNLAHCIDQRLQVLPQVDLKLPHGESGGRGDSQVDLLIISLTAEVNYFISPFPLGWCSLSCRTWQATTRVANSGNRYEVYSWQ